MRHHTRTEACSFSFAAKATATTVLSKWGIYRRRIPFGVKLSEGGFGSYRAALTAGKKALAELLEQIQREEEEKARD
jgi:hypothetical protein